MHLKTYASTSSQTDTRTLFVSFGATAALFLFVPLSQLIYGDPKPMLTAIPIRVTQAPPEIQITEEPSVIEEDLTIEVDPLESESFEMSLSSFGSALGLGIGGSGILEMRTEFEIDQNDFYTFADLDRPPRYLSGRPLDYPYEMRRAKVEGFVLLLVMIDKKGAVTVERVLEASHRAFEKAAIAFAEASTFESPRRGGEVVKAQFKMPIRFGINE